jgi:hypothetical protein
MAERGRGISAPLCGKAGFSGGSPEDDLELMISYRNGLNSMVDVLKFLLNSGV